MSTELTWFFDIGDTLVSDRAWLPGAESLLQHLNSAGAAVGLISNTGTLTRARLSLLLPATFDFSFFKSELVLLSSEVGLEKPDSRIFKLAVERSGSLPKDCIFVGENLNETLVAQEVGMRSARITNIQDDISVLTRI